MNPSFDFLTTTPGTRSAVSSRPARRRRSRFLRRVGCCLVGLALAGVAQALPTGERVSAGVANSVQNGNAMVINQQSQNLAINWQNFGVAAGESLTFNQPDAAAIALNRVLGLDPSLINGRMTSNGQVWILNPNGVLFGSGAQVHVGGLLASTLGLSDIDFLAGRRTFTGNGGSVTNQGALIAADRGYVALLGGRVSNEGVIQARLGTIALAAGNQITVDFVGDKLLGLQVEQGAIDALVHNRLLIQADGGNVLLTARAANAILGAVVNNEGIIEARTIDNVSGTIRLLGDRETGSVDVTGTLDASPITGGIGGLIETSGFRLNIPDTARITTFVGRGLPGLWLIDPSDFTIAPNGDISGAALGRGLDASNVTILSTQGATPGRGDIRVNDEVTWSGPNTLTLSALNNVRVMRRITSRGTGGVTLRADNTGACIAGVRSCGAVVFSGRGHVSVNGGDVNIYTNPRGSGRPAVANGRGPSYGSPTDYRGNVTLGGGSRLNAWMLVNDVNQLQAMTTRLGGRYALGRDIDASATMTWNAQAGFVPIGSAAAPFRGDLDGLNHTITGLTITRPTTIQVGLFGVADGSSIANVGLIGGVVIGQAQVGALVGQLASSEVTGSFSTAIVSGAGQVGGLVGDSQQSAIVNSFSQGGVSTPADSMGSLGGLVGTNDGVVADSHSTGSVTGGGDAGGLVGQNSGLITRSFSTGDVSGGSTAGGLVGIDFPAGSVNDSYSTGFVSGNNGVGGLIGAHHFGTVSTSYSTGFVFGNSGVGGLIGIRFAGTVADSYWDSQTSNTTIGVGAGSPLGATGLPTAQMKQQSSFSGFDFVGTWSIEEGASYPFLLAP